VTRKVEKLTITDEGRDKGKVFELTEMSAYHGDLWAGKVSALLRKFGAEIPEGTEEQGMAGVASAQQVTAGIVFTRALQDPSVSEWWDCVRYVHDPRHPPQAITFGADCQVEEIRTISELRMAVFKLHTAFFSTEKASTSG